MVTHKEYVVYVKKYGYYEGRNDKYADMFNVNVRKFAKRMSYEQAEKIKNSITKGGYEAEIDEVENGNT